MSLNPGSFSRFSRAVALVCQFYAAAGLCASASVEAEPAVSGGLAWDYWKPREELTESEAARVPGYCAGTYLWPVFPLPLTADDEDYPIQAEARHAEYYQSGEVRLDGDVSIVQGNRTLKTNNLEFNHKTRIARVNERVLIEEPSIILIGSSADIELDSKATIVTDAQYLLIEPEFRGTADMLELDADGNIEVTAGSFTRCEPTNNNWRISAKSFEIEKGSWYGVAKHAVVRIKDIPVFYTPRLSFPVNDERKSGWLFPNIGYNSDGGFDLGVPYYLNLAPDYDATVSPRWIPDRGLGVETEFRYLSGWQQTMLAGAILPNDDLYDGKLEKKDFERLEEAGLVTGPFDPANRWLYAMYHQGDIGHWHTTVNYTAVSDRDYFRNLDTELDVSSRRELERSGEVQYLNGGLDVRLWAQRFDRLDSNPVDPYQRLPQLDLNYTGYLPGAFEFSFGAAATSFDRNNDDLLGVSRVVGNRAHVEPRLRLPLVRSWGYMTFMGGFRYTQYDLRDTVEGVDDNPTRKIGLGSVDSGLFFERDMNFFGSEVIHTLEPRVFYLYQQYRDQDDLPRFDVGNLTFRYDQLFRDNRFTGLDRIGDADQLSLGFTSRFIEAASGREYLRASIGQIRYFRDRKVTVSGIQNSTDLTNSSELAANIVARAGRWAAGGNILWDPHDSEVDEGGGFVRFRSDNDHILHVGYRYLRRSDIDQTDIAMIWPVSKRYSMIGRWNYDVNSGRTIEALGGIEYNDCCWQVRIIGRRYLDSPSARAFAEAEHRNGAFLQVVFKGLAGFSGGIESLLSKSITGYVMEE